MTTSIAVTESPTKPTVHERRFYSRFWGLCPLQPVRCRSGFIRDFLANIADESAPTKATSAWIQSKQAATHAAA